MKRRVGQPRPSGVRRTLKEAEGKLTLIRGWEPEPFQVLCTDFTEIKYAGGMRKAYLMAMIDPGSGWVESWAVSKSADRELPLRCWEAAKESLAKVDRDPRGTDCAPRPGHGVHELPVALAASDRGWGGGVLL